jgi:Sugar-specific transcriptional regulator TrmB.
MASYYTVSEVSEMLGIKTSTAYQIIRKLNKELESKGYITIAGKISKRYFDEKIYN